MANKNHLQILTEQGPEAWTLWRKNHNDVAPDLADADLRGTDLHGGNLSGGDLRKARLEGADLRFTDLNGANLRGASLSSVDPLSCRRFSATLAKARLQDANLRWADLSGCELREADLRGANLVAVDLSDADLTEANLLEANLEEANLSGANLQGTILRRGDLARTKLYEAALSRTELAGANLSQARIGWTVFAEVDLSEVKGLSEVRIQGPCTIGVDTLLRSRWNIPKGFLLGAGIPRFLADYNSVTPGPLPTYRRTCQIYYSSGDQEFVNRLRADLQANELRSWIFAPDSVASDEQNEVFYRAERFDTVLLVLSQNSASNGWVESAIEMERERGRRLLTFLTIGPLDTIYAVFRSWQGSVGRDMRDRSIIEFTDWTDANAYSASFATLISHIKPA